MKTTDPRSKILPLDMLKMDLCIVVLESLYDSIDEDAAQSLFGKLASMKIAGYKKEYPYGACPIDAGDIIGNHLVLCERKSNGELDPIFGFKSISYSRSKIHRMEFPAFNLFSEANYPRHHLAIRQILDWADAKNEEVAYNGSWTVRADVRKDRVLKQLCYDTTLLMLVRYYTDYQIPHVIAGATLRFKVDEFKKFMGFEYLTQNRETLGNAKCHHFFDEEIAVMYLRKFSDEALRLADRYRSFWENRLTIKSAPPLTLKIKKAA